MGGDIEIWDLQFTIWDFLRLPRRCAPRNDYRAGKMGGDVAEGVVFLLQVGKGAATIPRR